MLFYLYYSLNVKKDKMFVSTVSPEKETVFVNKHIRKL